MRLFLPAAAALIAAAGCAGSNLNGTWKPIRPGQDEVIEGTTLEITGDRFVLKGFPRLEGQVKREGETITLDPESQAQQAVEPPELVFQLEDGKLVPDEDSRLPFVWVRAD